MKTSNKKYLPLFLDITSKNVLVIGGGNIGLQKLNMLQQFTNNITVLSKEVCSDIIKFDIRIILKEYEKNDLFGFDIVYVATNNRILNEQIKKDSEKLGLLANVVDNPDLCDFITPAIYKQENITIAVSSGGSDIPKAVQYRDKIKSLFHVKDNNNEKGKVYIVGFGPGDPELMTIKADRILHQSDVIIYDDLIDKNILNNYTAEKIYVGKRKGMHSKVQDEINQLIFQYANKGNTVARLKGGDPFIFGRGGEEFLFLKERLIDVEIIPGITSAFAASATSFIPLTHRKVSSSVAFCTGHPEKSIQIPNTDTIVFYMAASNLNVIIQKLIDSGKHPETQIALIENISLPEQKIVIGKLNTILEKARLIKSPLLIIVGDVVGLNN